jgi:hypothetical protein
MLAALLLLAADFVLAIIAWLIVEHVVREIRDADARFQKQTDEVGNLADDKACDSDKHALKKSEAMRCESDS